jgi:hypothetical protein
LRRSEGEKILLPVSVLVPFPIPRRPTEGVASLPQAEDASFDRRERAGLDAEFGEDD